MFDVAFLALEIDEGTKHNGDRLRVLADLEEVDFNIFGEVVFIEIAGELIVLLMGIAKEYDWLGIGQFEFQENILHLDWVVAFSLAPDDFLNRAELSALSGGFDIFVVNFFVVGGVDDGSEEEEDAVEGANALEHFDNVACA